MQRTTKTLMIAMAAMGWIAASAPAFAQPASDGDDVTSVSNPTIDGIPVFRLHHGHGYSNGVPTEVGVGSSAAPVVAPATAAPVVTIYRPTVPAEATTLMQRTINQLEARQVGAARNSVEQAETVLLNARRNGERGFARRITSLSDAREALARNDVAGASAAVQRALDGQA